MGIINDLEEIKIFLSRKNNIPIHDVIRDRKYALVTVNSKKLDKSPLYWRKDGPRLPFIRDAYEIVSDETDHENEIKKYLWVED